MIKNIPVQYPSVEYCETDTAKIVDKLINAYESITGRVLYPADPTRIFILFIADIISQEREILNYSAKMNIPRYAVGEFLDSLAEIFFNVYRLQAEAAKTTLRFEISKVLGEKYIIPKEIKVTVDGEIIFRTTETIIFEAGQQYAEVQAVCLTNGEIGNGFVPGQINKLVDEQFLYFKSVVNITESEGGADEEDDIRFYNRMRESIESYSTAGPKGSYVYHAKSTTSAISDIVADSPMPGVADIRVMLKNGVLPNDEILKKVKDKLSADNIRPMCDLVQVSKPDIIPFQIDLQYYLEYSAMNTNEMISNINAAVKDYIIWQTQKMGRDINPSKLHDYVMRAGAKRVEIALPVFQKVDNVCVAKLEGNPQIKHGGYEDE